MSKFHQSGTLYVVAAPSGAGKTSLVAALADSLPAMQISISHTTRSARPGEQDGVNYHFIDEAHFQEMIAADEFLEYATVFGCYYGTSKQAVSAHLASGNDVILEIDWQGAQQIHTLFPQSVSIFILPPSMAVLRERLLKRKQDSVDVIDARMIAARDEIAHYSEFDYIVINDNFDVALADLQAIVKAQRLRLANREAELLSLLSELEQ